jgi:hypothetical protein
MNFFEHPMTEKQTEKQFAGDDDDSMWVVYEAPADFPDQYVARRLHLNRLTGDYVVGNTLIEVRSKLPPGLFRIERSERDDPQIRETWI